ncbi:MAG: hypothetical protein EAZ39_15375 [Oscillatoriales cyanobacterium]|nr:MAG: hypothetical protein EAZ39_15375 [Oscillatoriales cyanobacterium]TAG43975.1 MAG: hypothetical protein EAZ33_11470 [Oscillatoriales cyanobacterium]
MLRLRLRLIFYLWVRSKYAIGTQHCCVPIVMAPDALTLSGLKTLRFLRNFVLNIPIARVPGRNPFAKEWWAAILAFGQAPQAFKGF